MVAQGLQYIILIYLGIPSNNVALLHIYVLHINLKIICFPFLHVIFGATVMAHFTFIYANAYVMCMNMLFLL